MNMLCALIATSMLHCGANDFKPINDFYVASPGHVLLAQSTTWRNQYGYGNTYAAPGGHTYTPYYPYSRP